MDDEVHDLVQWCIFRAILEAVIDVALIMHVCHNIAAWDKSLDVMKLLSKIRVIGLKHFDSTSEDLRTEIEIFPHDELGAWRAQAQCGQVGRRDAQWVHVRSQVTASLSRTRHHRLVQIRWYTTQRFASDMSFAALNSLQPNIHSTRNK